MFERLRSAVLKPIDPSSVTTEEPLTLEELQVAVKSANDKERIVGLIAAPLSAAIGILVMSALISNDPPVRLASGALNKTHVSLSLYHELTVVLLVMSVVMLVVAMLRKRLYLGMVMALYGLAVFNLHYWGFGLPFVMAGAWLLVRAYRLQRALREANGGAPWRPGSQALGSGMSASGRPRSNKRYTPPSSGRSRASRPKPANDLGTP